MDENPYHSSPDTGETRRPFRNRRVAMVLGGVALVAIYAIAVLFANRDAEDWKVQAYRLGIRILFYGGVVALLAIGWRWLDSGHRRK